MNCKPGDLRVLVARGLGIASTSADDGEATQQQQQQHFVTLPDPQTGKPASFLLAGGCLQELHWFKQQYSSWLLDNSVLQDGSLFLATPIDPLLVVLPLLEAARAQQNVFQDLEQILSMAPSPASAHLLRGLLGGAEQLGCLCDVKLAGGQRYFRLSDQRVAAWLALKATAAKAALHASPSAAFSGMDDESLTAYAAGLLGEYLAPHWQKQLAAALHLPEDVPLQQQAPHAAPPRHDYDSSSQPPPSEKRPRLDPKEAAKAKAAESRAAAKQAKLAKEATGMRKLSSFFGAKPPAAK